MKKILLFIGILLNLNILYSQKKVIFKKHTEGISNIDTNFKFANEIELKNWGKNEIYIEASVSLRKNDDNIDYNDMYTLKSNISNNVLNIYSDFGDFFKGCGNKSRYHHENNKNSTEHHNDCNPQVKINYLIYLPKSIVLKVKSISGSVNSSLINSKLDLDLISGNISIKNYTNDLKLKTISGDIDIFISDTVLQAETITGKIYSNTDIKLRHSDKELISNKIQGIVDSGKNKLTLSTISGNIYLRDKHLKNE
ncbi:DUF4097 family beta strand repeat-containing protein [Tenacibaculum sp. C7A-26P2]|uniref:DUF4097 family beta strand repeat-containing protein n=1 Tax=Tenacibaculum sp. C7A-26P2 TaxID=3447504 RepID=UPI003F829247